MKESDLYQPVKNLLTTMGYEVYAEVEPRTVLHRGRADVIGYSKPAACIVEMKTSLNFDVIEQAYRWLPYAHYIYVAIPVRKNGVPRFVLKILSQFGIGIIEVGSDFSMRDARIVLRAKFNRPKFKINWDKELLPEHQTWLEGGSNTGGYVTPYKLTIDRVKRLLSRNPHRWFSIKEILDHCETHYANPRNSLSKALREFEHEWCESKKEGNRLVYKMR